MPTDRGNPGTYHEQKQALYDEAEGRCHYCDYHLPYRNMEIDHVVPRAKGGTDHLENLVLACGACNKSKGTKEYHAFKAEMEST